MTADLPNAVLDRNRDAIRSVLAAFGVTDAGVFGSVARGEDTVASDLDLIVRFGRGARRDVIRLADVLSALTGMRVDVVDLERVFDRAGSTGIGRSILRETVPL